MADTIHRPQPSGEIVATDVSHEEYLEHYAHDHYEWVEGVVIKMPPVHDEHDELSAYFLDMFRAYLGLRPIGRVKQQPYTMNLVARSRQPDLMVILNDNPAFGLTGVNGPADICVELVSPDSVARDYVEKYREYEAGGVTEYWIIDWMNHEARFHQLNEMGTYTNVALDVQKHYHCKVLPDLKIHVPTLWRVPLPDFWAIGRAVQEMLAEDNDA